MEALGSISSNQASAFDLENTELRVRRGRIGCLLALFGTGSGVSLDYILYPELLMPLFFTRLVTVALIFVIYRLHTSEFGKRNIGYLGSSWTLVVNLSICVMVFLTEGASSSYYGGLNLVFLGAGVLLPWTHKETLSLVVLTMVGYVAACILRGQLYQEPIEWSLLFNNCFFVSLTGLISTTASFFNAKARIREFSLRQELDSRNQKLQDLDRLKSQFFANISHELRTPLTLILGPIQDLLKKPEALTSNVAGLMRLARENALRLLKLVNDLLEVIKLEEGKSRMNLRGIDLNEFVSGVVNSMIHMSEFRKIDLKVELSNESIIVHADTYALERVFLNLLSNAIKFTSPGGVITVRTSMNAGKAIIDVIDTGIGISEADIPHIFDRFRQADSSNTRRYQGSGLGLALVKDLAEKMDGAIRVKSEIDVGTTMTVELALHEGPVEELVAPEKQDEDVLLAIHQSAEQRAALPASTPFGELESRLPEGDGPSLMIVDDEPDMRQYLVGFLEEDYRISQVRDGQQALELAREYLPDLMLLDLMLPELDGHEVCRRLKGDSKTRNIKIVLLTARVDEGAKIIALENGADDFLTKPFSRTEVETRLRNLLETSKLESELIDRNDDLENALSELKQSQSNLIRSEKLNALGGLAAGLLHEVNNPLNYVISAIQLARMEPIVKANEDLTEYLDDINEGVGRIRNIVSDLHTFAHPSEVDKRKAFSMSGAIESSMRFTASECTNMKIVLELADVDTILGSEGHIVQVLINLLSNASGAIKQLDKSRPGKIAIRSERFDDRMRVSVSDNGIGMDEETMERVFEPFYTTKDVGEGMGLGLSICHTIIQSHGGTLEVKSVEGECSEFTFDLPLFREKTSGDQSAAITSNGVSIDNFN
ncbi:MAG: signal transduction histidine kinase [Candidatus Pelagisphaera sp.]|jgi:signal transduction histidine kinase